MHPSSSASSASCRSYGLRLLVDPPGILGVVSDRGQADATALGEAADHVEHHSGPAGLVEMQTVADDDVEELRDGQCLEPFVLEVVGRDQVLAAAAGRQEDPALAVVGAVGEELQGQERMGGAALAEVQLDRVRRPRAAIVLHHNEIHREPAEHAELCETPPDHHRGLCDGRGVVRDSPGTRSRDTSDRSRHREAGRGWTAARRCRRAVPASGHSDWSALLR